MHHQIFCDRVASMMVLGQAGCLCVSPQGARGDLHTQAGERTEREYMVFRSSCSTNIFLSSSTYPESPPACKSVPNPHLRLPSHYWYVAQGARLPAPPTSGKPQNFLPTANSFTASPSSVRSRKFFVFGFVTAVVVALKRPFVGLGYGQY